MMAHFRFRLETLLRLRHSTRDQCRLRLAEAHRADEVLQERLLQLSEEESRLCERRRQAMTPGTLDVRRLAEADRYAAILRGKEAQLQEERKSLAAEIQSRRNAVLEADREARTLEKLRDGQKRQYRLDEERRESKQLDEAAVPAYLARCGAAICAGRQP